MKPYYEQDGIIIYHGDSRQILSYIAPVDVTLTDPPYGVSGQQNSKTAGSPKKNEYGSFKDCQDYVLAVAVPVIMQALSISKRLVMTPGNRCLTFYPAPDSFGCLYQPASVGLQPWGRADAQPIFYYGKFPRDSKDIPGNKCSYTLTESPEKNGHPCPKPYSIWRRMLEKVSLPGETVLDPFMGSGTTLRAAKDLGLKAIGIEIEEKYCEISAKRLAQQVLEFAV